jgi:endonuclease/exonuclease/phosphatase family metal-dependent hydrolase
MKYVFSMTLALILLTPACVLAYTYDGDTIDVMTQNQYLGTDLTPVIAATDAGAFNQAVIDALQQIADNHYPARARKLAQLIARRLPELVGLQEVFDIGCSDLESFVGLGCDDPQIDGAFNDHLALTLEALEQLDQPFNAVAVVNNLDVVLPVDLNNDAVPDIAVTILDRDVILARSDIAADPVDFGCEKSSGDGCNYEAVASVTTPVGDVDIDRGWVGVDATIRGKNYRFVNTHLEVPELGEGIVQAAQAAELISYLDNTTPSGRHLIVVGDMNSSPDDISISGIVSPYLQFLYANYTDAWTELPILRPGYTCCQDVDLSNRHSLLDTRIDEIFSADIPYTVRRGHVLGTTIFDKTWSTWPNLLWPSDHGSVAVELGFE